MILANLMHQILKFSKIYVYNVYFLRSLNKLQKIGKIKKVSSWENVKKKKFLRLKLRFFKKVGA